MSLLDLTLSAAHPVMSTAVSAVGHVLTLPDSDPQAPGELTDDAQRVIGFAKWAALIVAVVALIIWGALVAWSSHRGRGEDLAGGLGKILFGVVAISGGVSILTFIVG